MRRLVQSLVLVGVLGLVAPAAFADVSAEGSLLGSTDKGAGGLLNGNVTVFGVPDPETGAMSTKVGVAVDGSLYSREWGGDGPCTASVGVGNVSAEASIGFDPAIEREVGPGASNPPGEGGIGPSCTLSAEASLVSIEGECKTPVGTFGANAQGVGAEASCGCDGCEASAYWAKAEGSYTTPSIGGCGIKGSVTVTGGAMAGVGIGAEKVGDAGGGITVGPVKIGAGVNIDELDLGATADCIADAAAAVADTAVAIGEGIVDIGGDILGGIGDGLGAIGDGLGGLASGIGGLFGGGDDGGGILGGIGGFFGGGGDGGGILGGIGGLFGGGGGSNVDRADATTPVAIEGGRGTSTPTADGAGMAGALGRD